MGVDHRTAADAFQRFSYSRPGLLRHLLRHTGDGPCAQLQLITVCRYHWMVLVGSQPSSRRAAIRLTRACPVLDTGLIPNRCRPTATSRRWSWGSLRFRHKGQVRAMNTCSVTSAGTTGMSMTSRVHQTGQNQEPS